MAGDQALTCGRCGKLVAEWPYAIVPQGDGTATYFHDACEPWRVDREELALGFDPAIPEGWRPVVSAIVDRLVAKDYAGLARDGFVRYTNDPDDVSIGMWLEDYPATLVSLPEEAWRFAERGPVVNHSTDWWIVVDLWTAEEGRSDLSMEAIVGEDGRNLRIGIDNVHVM